MDFIKSLGGFLKTKMAVIVVAVLLVGGLTFYYRNLFVAATVDGSPISRWSVISEMEKASGKSTLDSLITKKLIEKEVAAKNITVSTEEVDMQIKNIEEQIKNQGSTLEAALADRNMSMDDLREQITINKSLEKLLADKIAVSDEEVQKFIADNGGAPKDAGAEFTSQIKNQLQSQKFSEEAGKMVDMLKAQASINYFVEY